MLEIEQPEYRPEDLSVGIVHFGVGNFHRSHQAMYLDRLFSRGVATDWAICGIGLLPGDARMRDVLRGQHMRYTLVERHPDGTAPARSIASIVDFLHAPDDPEAVFERLADPRTRIVSLTITEGGYNISDATGRFSATTPAVQSDLQPGTVPSTVFGVVVEGLRRRRERGVPPFTVMSCDNLPGNGIVARESFTAFATLLDPDLGSWIREHVPFPNSMVDRITPVTTDADRADVADTYGVVDGWPVLSEDFVQWVLEDRFSIGRPPLEQVGVQLVPDVVPYEHMKLRLLNAGHQVIAYFGSLLGHRFVHEALADPAIVSLLTRFMKEEAEPTLAPVPGIDLDEYERTLVQRFSNPYVRDTLQRLGTDGSDRIPKFLLPTVVDRSAAGLASPLSAAVVASWAVFARGVDTDGAPIDVVDRQRSLVDEAVGRQEQDPAGFLTVAELVGGVSQDDAFARSFASAYRSILDHGPRAALEQLLGAER
ncbi:mannitol dehydrogenase family protein [uncultured Amnibacterium sp.]|uniref:mannitol dehydrogenase family protein n=1 Tax=uncultured Amnibacterium sp. TaxID=1631851 RepID=UPI0035CBF2FF